MKRSYAFLLLLLSVMVFSCQKEISLETGRLPGDTSVIVTPGGNTCVLAKIVEVDSASNVASYAYVSSFNTERKVVNHDLIDSALNAIDGSFTITYPTGRIQLDPEQYFVVGANGKVSEFHGYESPDLRQGEKYTVKYTYNAAGQLTLRTETYDSLPNIVQYQNKFTYSGGNLATEVYEGNGGQAFIKLFDIVYSYDASKTVKNGIYLYGYTREIATFQAMLDAGTRSINPVSRVVVTYNPLTGLSGSYTTNFVNYVIDTKGYVQSFNVTSDDFALAGLSAHKKYRLGYSCY